MAVTALKSNAIGFSCGPGSAPSHVMYEGREGASQSWKKGAVLKLSSGKLIVAAAGDGGSADLVGIASSDASGVTDAKVEYYPISPEMVFEATLEDQSAVDHALVVGDMYAKYGIHVDSGGKFYVNSNETTNVAVRVVAAKSDEDITNAVVRARVLVRFLASKTIYG